MSAYIVTEKILIKRQEGDYPATIKIVVPESIDMSLYTEVKFCVFTEADVLVFSKTITNSGVEVTGQDIDVTLTASDTIGKSGKHKWECEISNSNEAITIGEGIFMIKKQLITT